MEVVTAFALFMVPFACGQEIPMELVVQTTDALADTELLTAFVIFRHGDRTPDEEELELYPSDIKNKNIFFPYGMKALTNRGKQRGYRVGQYIRTRYDSLLSKQYLPDEIEIRTTDYSRTKMTVLTALAAIYPPSPAQKWNPALDWQPVPYNTVSYNEDDLLYWYNCPRYLWLRDKVYEQPEVVKKRWPYDNLFHYMSEMTGTNITTTEQVFYLDNLFQAMENVGVKPPKWAQDVMPQIKEVTKIEYALEFYTPEMIRLATGVLMSNIINATNAVIAGHKDQPKVRLYSAHENNVAALMAAARVFQPHQPNYGATFTLELRRHRLTGSFGILAVYSKNAGGPEQILSVADCGDGPICDYGKFLSLTQNVLLSPEEFEKQCPRR